MKKTWQNCPANQWMLANLYRHFNKADKERRHLATANNLGYASKNKVDPTSVPAAAL
jgi:hypothetical protein